jgi:hypothetical protein
MANSQEIIRYKQQIASILINDPEIVKWIDNKDIEEPEELINQNIFNFIRYPYAPEEEVTYIAFEIDVPSVHYKSNVLFKKLVITFYVVSHERLMPTDDINGGVRNDLIAARIDKLFNGRKDIGKKPLELISNTADGISVKHRRRIIQFTTDDLDDGKCVE